MTYQFFSIIIPSYNRSAEIVELLSSIEKLNFPIEQFEVIVSDDGSTDDTAHVVKLFQKDVSYVIKYLIQQNKGPGPARNNAMEKAKGDFFIFVDSDVSVPAHWLKEIARKLDKEKADAYGGPDSYRNDFSPFLKAVNYSMTSFLTTGGLRGRKGKKLAKFYPRSFNMGISRNLYKKIGGFINLRHGQDIEFSSRIIKSGAKIIFIEKAFVYHIRRTNFRRFFRQVFNWGVARINLYKIDRHMLEPLHFLPAIFTILIIITSLLAAFSVIFKNLFLAGIIILSLLIIYSVMDALRMYRSLKPAMIVPVVIFEQIIGYGLGFIYNFIRRIICNKEEKVGFKKHYYK